jgi:hypothetical protein
MEQRGTCGPAVDLWPQQSPPSLATLQHVLHSCAAEPCVALHHGRLWCDQTIHCPSPRKYA